MRHWFHWLSHRLVDWMIDWFLCRTWSLCARVDIWWWFLIIGWRNRSRFHSKKAFRCWAIMNEALLFLQPICPDSGWEIPWIQHVQSWAHHMISYEHLTQKYIRLGCFCGFWWGPIVLLAKQDFDWMKLMPQLRKGLLKPKISFFAKLCFRFCLSFRPLSTSLSPTPGWVRGSKLHSSRNFESAWNLTVRPVLLSTSPDMFSLFHHLCQHTQIAMRYLIICHTTRSLEAFRFW